MGTGPVVYTRVISTWFDRKRGVALAVVVSGAAIGGIVHPAASQAMVDLVGWRTACLLLGAAILVIGVPIAALFVRQREECSRNRRDRAPEADAAALGSAAGLAGLAGRLTTGWLVDRFDAARVAFALLCLVAVGSSLPTSERPLAVTIIAGFVMAFGAGGELDAIPYLLSRYFGVRSMAALYGLVWSAWGIAGAIGSVVMGRVFDATGSYDGALLGFASTTAAVAMLMLTLPAYARAPREPMAV